DHASEIYELVYHCTCSFTVSQAVVVYPKGFDYYYDQCPRSTGRSHSQAASHGFAAGGIVGSMATIKILAQMNTPVSGKTTRSVGYASEQEWPPELELAFDT